VAEEITDEDTTEKLTAIVTEIDATLKGIESTLYKEELTHYYSQAREATDERSEQTNLVAKETDQRSS
jgi:hypothetical protein